MMPSDTRLVDARIYIPGTRSELAIVHTLNGVDRVIGLVQRKRSGRWMAAPPMGAWLATWPTGPVKAHPTRPCSTPEDASRALVDEYTRRSPGWEVR
jgi:hypothetical protein